MELRVTFFRYKFWDFNVLYTGEFYIFLFFTDEVYPALIPRTVKQRQEHPKYFVMQRFRANYKTQCLQSVSPLAQLCGGLYLLVIKIVSSSVQDLSLK